ncbi:MAG: hypothetical protein ACKO96_13110, partial [Flammeovirgaceae bacterium]
LNNQLAAILNGSASGNNQTGLSNSSSNNSNIFNNKIYTNSTPTNPVKRNFWGNIVVPGPW